MIIIIIKNKKLNCSPLTCFCFNYYMVRFILKKSLNLFNLFLFRHSNSPIIVYFVFNTN